MQVAPGKLEDVIDLDGVHLAVGPGDVDEGQEHQCAIARRLQAEFAERALQFSPLGARVFFHAADASSPPRKSRASAIRLVESVPLAFVLDLGHTALRQWWRHLGWRRLRGTTRKYDVDTALLGPLGKLSL